MPEHPTDRPKAEPATGRVMSVIAWAAVSLVIFFGLAAWLDANSFHALAGDDVRSFTYARDGFRAYNSFFIEFYRFRPVTALLGSLCAQITGGEFDQLRLIAYGVHTLNALLVCGILVQVIELPVAAAFAMAIAATFTRFTNYLIMAETGVIR
jgi:hypothetical protein